MFRSHEFIKFVITLFFAINAQTVYCDVHDKPQQNSSTKGVEVNKTLIGHAANLLPNKAGLSNLTIIPEEKLCVFCHLVLKRFKQQISKNSDQFKKDLISSCASLNDEKETKKCIEKIDDSQIKRISNTPVAELCLQEKLCTDDENISAELDRAAPGVAPMDPIPEVKSEDKEKAEKLEISTQQQELVKMYTTQ